MRYSLLRVMAVSSVVAALVAPSALAQTCAGNPNALGVGRTVEIDTAGGPAFGFEHYKVHDFLMMKEVVLTFDDGPQKLHTQGVLDALAQHCTKATFFSVGKMALGYPEIIREVAKQGHTVGTHTWSHANLRAKKTDAEVKEEIEKGVSGVRRALGGPVAPFFRYPYLQDSKDSLAHLSARNMAVFSTDIDSFDFKLHNAEQLVKSVMSKLEKKGKGIILMHDVQPGTPKALPMLLTELKTAGYKVVHMKAKGELKTLAEYDAMIESSAKGLAAPGTERPTSSVVKTIEPVATAGAQVLKKP